MAECPDEREDTVQGILNEMAIKAEQKLGIERGELDMPQDFLAAVQLGGSDVSECSMPDTRCSQSLALQRPLQSSNSRFHEADALLSLKLW